MRKYVAILKDKKKGELTTDLLYKHVNHLQNLTKDTKLFICGPFKGNDRAMQILICETIDEAIHLVESDPFIKEGYYATYEVNELIEANENNNWLMDIPQTKENLTE
ncbi:YciI family protein [Caldibacillus lycopersici]|uniref:YciI family protein n=1 Tax=Perspicuibacillus lycopersici TaxID=1325689 RepID=A0AAE3IXD2_9BACI|nr:YciI family protein [Perspicuibacillus lycopersici]MCU9613785.1 YciI family protein [Perspicuibacillus lycopersici]